MVTTRCDVSQGKKEEETPTINNRRKTLPVKRPRYPTGYTPNRRSTRHPCTSCQPPKTSTANQHGASTPPTPLLPPTTNLHPKPTTSTQPMKPLLTPHLPSPKIQTHPNRTPHSGRRSRHPRQTASQPPRLPPPRDLRPQANLVRRFRLATHHGRLLLGRPLRFCRRLPRCSPCRLAPGVCLARGCCRCFARGRQGRAQVPGRLAVCVPRHQRRQTLGV